MKKKIGVVCLLVLAAVSLPAAEFILGPKVILSEMNYRGSDLGAKNALSLSCAGGVFLDIQLTSLVGIQSEVLINTYSLRYKSGSNDYNLRFNVLSLPLYARFNFERSGLDMYVLGGARFDIRIVDRGHITINDSVYYADVSDYNSLYIGAAGGAGMILPTQLGVFNIGIGAYYGFVRELDEYDWYHWDVEVQLSYGFSL